MPAHVEITVLIILLMFGSADLINPLQLTSPYDVITHNVNSTFDCSALDHVLYNVAIIYTENQVNKTLLNITGESTIKKCYIDKVSCLPYPCTECRYGGVTAVASKPTWEKVVQFYCIATASNNLVLEASLLLPSYAPTSVKLDTTSPIFVDPEVTYYLSCSTGYSMPAPRVEVLIDGKNVTSTMITTSHVVNTLGLEAYTVQLSFSLSFPTIQTLSVQCRAINSEAFQSFPAGVQYGYATDTLQAIANDIIKFDLSEDLSYISTQTVVAGQSATFFTKYYSHSPILSHQWLNMTTGKADSGVEILLTNEKINFDYIGKRYTLDGTGVQVTIPIVQKQMEGFYDLTMSVDSQQKSTFSRQFRLIVWEKGSAVIKVLWATTYFTLLVGSSTEFTCEALNVYPMPKIEWFLGTKNLSIQSNVATFGVNTDKTYNMVNSLRFTPYVSFLSTTVNCKVVLPGNLSITSSSSITLDLLVPGIFEPSSINQTVYLINQATDQRVCANVYCNLESAIQMTNKSSNSKIPVNVLTKKVQIPDENGNVITRDGKSVCLDLLVVEPYFSGEYEVMIESFYTYFEQSFEEKAYITIFVGEPSLTPTNLDKNMTTTESFQILWSYMDISRPPLWFEVTLNNNLTYEVKYLDNQTAYEFVFNGLLSATKYRVGVRSVSHYGNSTEVSLFVTTNAVPIVIPEVTTDYTGLIIGLIFLGVALLALALLAYLLLTARRKKKWCWKRNPRELSVILKDMHTDQHEETSQEAEGYYDSRDARVADVRKKAQTSGSNAEELEDMDKLQQYYDTRRELPATPRDINKAETTADKYYDTSRQREIARPKGVTSNTAEEYYDASARDDLGVKPPPVTSIPKRTHML